MNKTTQNASILKALKKGSRITPLQALTKYGCFRLGARIWDLKRMGHDIKTRFVTRQGKTFAEYSLE